MLKKTTTENSNPLCPVLKPFQEPVFKEKSSDKTLSVYSLDEKPLVTFNVRNTNCINESLPNLIINPQFGIKSLTSHIDKSLVTLKNLNSSIPNTIIDLRPEQRIFVEGNIKHNPLSYTKENFIDKIVQNDKGISLQMPIILDAEWFDQNNIEKILNGGIKSNVEHYIKPRTGLTVQMKTWGKNNEKIFTTPFLHNHLIKNGHNIRHDTLKNPLVIIDQMKSLGIPASVRRIERYDEDKKNKLAKIPNKLIIPFYLYFGVADYGFIANDDDYRKDLKSFYANKKGRTITFDKHLSSKYVGDDNSCETPFKTNWIININGTEFVVWLKFIDLVAMLGNRGLDSAFQIAGVEQKKEKDLIRDYEKSNMLGVYIDKPYEFDKYAGIADLQLDVLIDKIINLDNKIYDDFKLDYLPDAYKQPSKTIGSSVVNLFNAVLTEKILGSECQNVKPQNLEYLTGLEEKTSLKKLVLKDYKKIQNNIFEVLTKDASAESLLKYINQDFTFLLAKVQAGRCRNNKPAFFSSTFLSYDIDISGCYNRAMGILDYPLGSPVIFTCKTSKKKEKIISNEKVKTKKGSYNKIRYRFEVNKPVVSLETLINHFNLDDPEKCQLVDNLWFLNITTMENLTYFQSLIPSFYDTTYEKYKSRKMDVCSKNGDLDFNSGTITILGHEIINGVLTSELLRNLKQNNSAKIYQDFIKKVGVTAGVFYPKNLKCENVDQVIEKRILKDKNCNKKKKRDFDINIEGVQIVNENDCHAWTSYNLGNLIIDKLRFFRNKYDKGTPENEFYKLISNTIYGDQVSRFFITSNIVVANNITANVRSYMWILENSLFLNGSITDGDVAFFHEALYPTNDGHFNTAKLHIADYEKNHTLQGNNICQKKPLMNIIHDEINKEIIINSKNYDNKEEVDQIVLKRINEHIRSVFPNSSLLTKKYQVLDEKQKDVMIYKNIDGLFELEIKSYNNFYARKNSSDYVLNKIILKKDLLQQQEKINHKIKINGEFLEDDNFNKESINKHNSLLEEQKNNLEKNYIAKIRSHRTNQRSDGNLKTEHISVELITDLKTDELKKNIDFLHSINKKNDLNDKKLKKKYESIFKKIKKTEFKLTNQYNQIAPATQYLLDLHKNPENVPYPIPCVVREILKPNKINNDLKYKNTTLMMGDDILRKIIVHPFATTQYTYLNKKQRDAWIKANNQSKNIYGLGLCIYFINKDGTINVNKMNTTFRKWIEEGVNNPLQKLQKNKLKNLNSPKIQTVINTSIVLSLIFKEVVQDDYWVESEQDYFDFIE